MAIKHTSWPIEVTKEKVKPKPEEKKIEPSIKEENATRPKKKQQKRIYSY